MTEEEKRRADARKFAKHLLDSFLKADIFDHVDFVKKAYPLADMRDVGLGYVIGMVAAKYECHCILSGLSKGSDTEIKDVDVVMKVLYENLPKIIDKLEKIFCS